MSSDIQPIPIFVLTGFLGSGKTTLLNQILKNAEFENSAVIINEYGDIGIDHHLVSTGDDNIIELSNGCLCCTIRGQLVETIENLLPYSPEKILIETTGLAEPTPILQALLAAPSLLGKIEFKSLICLADAFIGIDRIENQQEANSQIALSDKIIISKLDLFDPYNRKKKYSEFCTYLAQINPNAELLSASHFIENLSDILNKNTLIPPAHYPDLHQHKAHHHSENIKSITLSAAKPVSLNQIEMFVDLLLSAHADHILRMKAIVNIKGESRPLVMQTAGHTRSPPLFLDQWREENTDSRIVVFVKDMDPQFIARLFNGFLGIPEIDSPDHQALTDNPLAIPGL